ncbi:MAG: hypothetical protein KDB90_18000, partial [Planctomycetes bacterium]|nr:hypothetical protein [Planctomycetota bacterium]
MTDETNEYDRDRLLARCNELALFFSQGNRAEIQGLINTGHIGQAELLLEYVEDCLERLENGDLLDTALLKYERLGFEWYVTHCQRDGSEATGVSRFNFLGVAYAGGLSPVSGALGIAEVIQLGGYINFGFGRTALDDLPGILIEGLWNPEEAALELLSKYTTPKQAAECRSALNPAERGEFMAGRLIQWARRIYDLEYSIDEGTRKSRLRYHNPDAEWYVTEADIAPHTGAPKSMSGAEFSRVEGR